MVATQPFAEEPPLCVPAGTTPDRLPGYPAHQVKVILPPSLFCVLTTSPDLEKALVQSWARYTRSGLPPP